METQRLERQGQRRGRHLRRSPGLIPQTSEYLNQPEHNLDSWRPQKGKRCEKRERFVEPLINVISTSAISLGTEFHHLHIKKCLLVPNSNLYSFIFTIIYCILLSRITGSNCSANLLDLIY